MTLKDKCSCGTSKCMLFILSYFSSHILWMPLILMNRLHTGPWGWSWTAAVRPAYHTQCRYMFGLLWSRLQIKFRHRGTWLCAGNIHFDLFLHFFLCFSLSLPLSQPPIPPPLKQNGLTTASTSSCGQYVEMKERTLVALGLLWKRHPHRHSQSVHLTFMWESWTRTSEARKRNKLISNVFIKQQNHLRIQGTPLIQR